MSWSVSPTNLWNPRNAIGGGNPHAIKDLVRTRKIPMPMPMQTEQEYPQQLGFDAMHPQAQGFAKVPGVMAGREWAEPVTGQGFAKGTIGTPLKKLKKPFWVGEAGPELAEVKNGKLTVIPNHALRTKQGVEMAHKAMGKGFARGTGVAQVDAPAPIGKYGLAGQTPGQSIVASGAVSNPVKWFPSTATSTATAPTSSAPAPSSLTPLPAIRKPIATISQRGSLMDQTYKPIGHDYAPAASRGMEWTGTGWAHPVKMRRSDQREFLRSPQGVAFQMQQDAKLADQTADLEGRKDMAMFTHGLQQQASQSELEGRRGLATFTQGLQDQSARKQQAYQQKLTDEEIGAAIAGSGPLLQDYLNQGLITQQQFQDYSSETKPRIRASMAKTLIQLGAEKQQAKAQQGKQVVGAKALPNYDVNGNIIGYTNVVETQAGDMKPMGTSKPPEPPKEPSASKPLAAQPAKGKAASTAASTAQSASAAAKALLERARMK